MWEMAASSLHDTARANVLSPRFVGGSGCVRLRCWDGRKTSCWVVPCGKRGSRWKERFDYRAQAKQTKERSQRCLAWLTHSSGSVSLLWGLGRRIAIFPRRCCLCGHLEHQKRVQFEGCVAEPLQTITAILFGSKWSCLLLRFVLQNAKVFVDDLTASMDGGNNEST